MGEDLSPAVAVRSDDMALASTRKDQFEAPAHLEDISVASSEVQAPEAPINWPAWKRNAQILMVATHSMVCVFMAAGLIPGYEAMAEEYNITMHQATYLTSVQILILGIAPFFWIPITMRYGRYHIFMFSVLGTMLCNIGGVFCKTFGAQMATRAIAAWLISPPLGIGSGVVTELCYPEERARKLGWWTLLITIGIPGGAFINGFVVQHLGVAWVFWIFAIINGIQFIAYLLLGDETLFVKDFYVSQKPTSGWSRLVPCRLDPRPFELQNFIAPLFLGRFPRILIPGIAYGVEFAYANIAIIVETPLIFGEKFHFNAQQVGYQFVSIIIGSVIGEQVSGPISDWFLKFLQRRKGHTIPADRLWLSYIGYGTVFAGLLVWGFQLEKATRWNITPCIGMAIAAFGNQVLTTILISFAVDSHKEHSASIGVFINLCRQIYGFCGPFYFPDMYAKLGLSGAAGVMCGIIAIVSLTPVLLIQLIDIRRQPQQH
ncbi:Major facilitator superfamily domain general substrate transporter [Penicillium cf. griseofulvum]|nr:Major facilitator superfamily domain general substrate transporter [Penicillium cf. griseofulvum]KAJ5451754.1 Major facilitator superfamily domain general substrate transporter [Penicillium cf. griseofulvum]